MDRIRELGIPLLWSVEGHNENVGEIFVERFVRFAGFVLVGK
jgi:hypothetical protein